MVIYPFFVYCIKEIKTSWHYFFFFHDEIISGEINKTESGLYFGEGYRENLKRKTQETECIK